MIPKMDNHDTQNVAPLPENTTETTHSSSTSLNSKIDNIEDLTSIEEYPGSSTSLNSKFTNIEEKEKKEEFLEDIFFEKISSNDLEFPDTDPDSIYISKISDIEEDQGNIEEDPISHQGKTNLFIANISNTRNAECDLVPPERLVKASKDPICEESVFDSQEQTTMNSSEVGEVIGAEETYFDLLKPPEIEDDDYFDDIETEIGIENVPETSEALKEEQDGFALTKELPSENETKGKKDPRNAEIQSVIAKLDELQKGVYYFTRKDYQVWWVAIRRILEKGPYSAQELVSAVCSYRDAGYPLDRPFLFESVVNDAVRHRLPDYDKKKYEQKEKRPHPVNPAEQAKKAGVEKGRPTPNACFAVMALYNPKPLEEWGYKREDLLWMLDYSPNYKNWWREDPRWKELAATVPKRENLTREEKMLYCLH